MHLRVWQLLIFRCSMAFPRSLCTVDLTVVHLVQTWRQILSRSGTFLSPWSSQVRPIVEELAGDKDKSLELLKLVGLGFALKMTC